MSEFIQENKKPWEVRIEVTLDWIGIILEEVQSKGSGNTPFIDLGVGYASMLSLWKFIKMSTYDFCTLYIFNIKKKLF